ncbi:MAG: hypothetical protein F4206_12580 [Gammaproteobacteria bacterium]|nr:hypothetical protein [Gammaproteobacteria bacterium]MYG67543.1 hypothetical protein [Gammaproteobacteria bacterium]
MWGVVRGRAGQWSGYTNEQHDAIRALFDAGVRIVTNLSVDRIAQGGVTASCVFSGRREEIEADWVLPLTRREPDDSTYHGLQAAIAEGRPQAPRTVARIGDCLAPGIIAAAVYGAYRSAVELHPHSGNGRSD